LPASTTANPGLVTSYTRPWAHRMRGSAFRGLTASDRRSPTLGSRLGQAGWRPTTISAASRTDGFRSRAAARIAGSTAGSSNTVSATIALRLTCGGAEATRSSSAARADSSPIAPRAATAASRADRSPSFDAKPISHGTADRSPCSPYAVATASTTRGSSSSRPRIRASPHPSPAPPRASAAIARTAPSASSVTMRQISAIETPLRPEATHAEIASRRTAASSWLRNGSGSSSSRTNAARSALRLASRVMEILPHPFSTARPVFLLPDRCARLDLVDQISPRFECVAPVRG
jgi:hypothetical protein